jgi:transcriptional regulator with XRE-family HTH domain
MKKRGCKMLAKTISSKGIIPMPRIRTQRSPIPHSEEDAKIGSRIKAIRRMRGLTQEEFGALIEQPQRVVSFFEQGFRRITATELENIAEALKVSYKELMGHSGGAKNGDQLHQNPRILRRLQGIEQLPKRDQQAIFRIIDNAMANVSHH